MIFLKQIGRSQNNASFGCQCWLCLPLARSRDKSFLASFDKELFHPAPQRGTLRVGSAKRLAMLSRLRRKMNGLWPKIFVRPGWNLRLPPARRNIPPRAPYPLVW